MINNAQTFPPRVTAGTGCQSVTVTSTTSAQSLVDTGSKATPPTQKPVAAMKLGIFSGQNVSLEAFLTNFEICSKYYSWNSVTCACFLQAALVGSASEMLWDFDSDANDTQVINLLKQRSGSACRCEAHRQLKDQGNHSRTFICKFANY